MEWEWYINIKTFFYEHTQSLPQLHQISQLLTSPAHQCTWHGVLQHLTEGEMISHTQSRLTNLMVEDVGSQASPHCSVMSQTSPHSLSKPSLSVLRMECQPRSLISLAGVIAWQWWLRREVSYHNYIVNIYHHSLRILFTYSITVNYFRQYLGQFLITESDSQ